VNVNGVACVYHGALHIVELSACVLNMASECVAPDTALVSTQAEPHPFGPPVTVLSVHLVLPIHALQNALALLFGCPVYLTYCYLDRLDPTKLPYNTRSTR
jgi:hypothetical protein